MTYGLRDLDGARVEVCDECGFDGRGERDLAASFAAVYAALKHLSTHPDASRRPEEETWSGQEYVEHCVDVASQILAACTESTGRPGAALTALSEVAAATAGLVEGWSDADWDVLIGWPHDMTVRMATLHLLHDLEHHVLDVRRGYAQLALADGVEVVTSR